MVTAKTVQAGIIEMIYPGKHNWGVGSDGVSDLCLLSQARLYFLVTTILFTMCVTSFQ